MTIVHVQYDLSLSAMTQSQEALWHRWLAIGSATGLTFILYWWSAAPGLTWAHFGADGGELLAAAVTNGVPHPPGYPLYMLLLRAWLWGSGLLWPTADLSWRGTLFSMLCAALSVGVTVRVMAQLLETNAWRWRWALLVGLAWGVAPMPWSQALITEVYALHMLFVALLGWATLVKPHAPRWLVPVIALGLAHHLTFLLLLPAVFYYVVLSQAASWRTIGLHRPLRVAGWMGLGIALALLFHLRTVFAASAGSPVNWGYPDNWTGFWWLVSGAAYRGYLFSAPSATLLTRIAAWASTLTNQLTPVGLAFMLLGLSQWDRQQPHLRNWSLIWLTPVSIYAINYYTRDSDIYLLPVIWLSMLWLGVGLEAVQSWLVTEWPTLRNRWTARSGRVGQEAPPNTKPQATSAQLNTMPMASPSSKLTGVVLPALVVVGLVGLTAWRWSTISARHDLRAQTFLAETMAVIEPHSIIISSADAETFALWYGAWGSGELLAKDPDTVLINYALYQFDWYRRLLREQYPAVVGESESVEEILAANRGQRPIYFSEKFSFWPVEELTPAGPIWRYTVTAP